MATKALFFTRYQRTIATHRAGVKTEIKLEKSIKTFSEEDKMLFNAVHTHPADELHLVVSQPLL